MHSSSNVGKLIRLDAGWSSLAARRAHNPKVVGSNPAPATRIILIKAPPWGFCILESGLKAHFLFWVTKGCRVMRQHEALEAVILPIVDGLGLQWVGLQYFPAGRRSLLRLYVDKPGGVSCGDCEQVSRQVNAVLSVEDVVKGDYLLEVSSPGLDRLLFTLPQCREHVGKRVAIRLVAPLEGKRNFKGELHVEGEKIGVRLDNNDLVTFPFIDIEEARLVPEW